VREENNWIKFYLIQVSMKIFVMENKMQHETKLKKQQNKRMHIILLCNYFLFVYWNYSLVCFWDLDIV